VNRSFISSTHVSSPADTPLTPQRRAYHSSRSLRLESLHRNGPHRRSASRRRWKSRSFRASGTGMQPHAGLSFDVLGKSNDLQGFLRWTCTQPPPTINAQPIPNPIPKLTAISPGNVTYCHLKFPLNGTQRLRSCFLSKTPYRCTIRLTAMSNT
jgi:hypothetical protein